MADTPVSPSVDTVAANDDLLAEILVRTPMKSLMKFKCVSKHWSSLIAARHFGLLHTLHRPNSKPSGLLLRHKPSLHTAATAADSDFEMVPLNSGLSRASPFTSFSFIGDHPPGSSAKILQSCNGFLLCGSFPYTIGTRRIYYIVNPTTKQYIELDPPPLEDGGSTAFLGVNLAFDPSKSPHYKVVCVQITLRSLYNYRIWIYSSKTRSWKISMDSFTAPFDMVFTEGVFWNGAIHWINPCGASLCFDVDAECFRKMPEIPLPQNDLGKRRCRFFGESDGHLNLIEFEGRQTTQFHVLEMKSDYSQWFVKYSVNLDGLVAEFPEIAQNYLELGDANNYDFSILGVHHEKNEDGSLLVLRIPGKIVSYNFKNSSSEELLNFAPENADKRLMPQGECFDVYQYVETLAPV